MDAPWSDGRAHAPLAARAATKQRLRPLLPIQLRPGPRGDAPGARSGGGIGREGAAPPARRQPASRRAGWSTLHVNATPRPRAPASPPAPRGRLMDPAGPPRQGAGTCARPGPAHTSTLWPRRRRPSPFYHRPPHHRMDRPAGRMAHVAAPTWRAGSDALRFAVASGSRLLAAGACTIIGAVRVDLCRRSPDCLGLLANNCVRTHLLAPHWAGLSVFSRWNRRS